MTDFIGTPADETFDGSTGNDRAWGGDGSDTLNGYGGRDRLQGDAGGDSLFGGDGNDTLVSFAFDDNFLGGSFDDDTDQDHLFGGIGGDTIAAGYGDEIDGGANADVLLASYLGAPNGVTADFSLLPADGTTVDIGGVLIASVEGVAVVNGSNFDDELRTDLSDQPLIRGEGGDDTLYGQGGINRLEGDAGADTLYGGSTRDYLVSFAPDDTFYLLGFQSAESHSLDIGSEVDHLFGGGGDDIVAAGYGDEVDGGDGFNTLYLNLRGSPAGLQIDFRDLESGPITIGGATIQHFDAVAVDGSDFDDDIVHIGGQINGNGGDDTLSCEFPTTLYGDDGNDVLYGLSTKYHLVHTLYGGADNDTLHGMGYGGDGDDSILDDTTVLIYGGRTSYGGAGDDIIQSSATDDFANDVFGEDGDDTLQSFGESYGGNGDDTMTGGGTLHGDSGGDNITAGDDGDKLFSDSGADTGLERDTLIAGGGGDELSIGFGDNADGGDGTDSLTIVCDPSLHRVRLATAPIVSGGVYQFGHGIIQNVEKIDTLRLTDGNDVVHVGAQSGTVKVFGNDGHDRLFGGGSDVHLYGGEGNDELVATSSGDILEGGNGDDEYAIGITGEKVIEQADNGADTVIASITYTLTANVENLTLAGDADPTGTGNGLANKLLGNDGANALSGMANADVLIGGAGRDSLAGGSEADRFAFRSIDDFAGVDEASVDHITDFNQAELDRIDLHVISAGDGNRKFHFIGTAAFDGGAGELRYEISGGHTLITGDVDGDAAADFMLVLDNVVTLTRHDFFL